MLECLLVVAISVDDVVVTRSMSYLKDIQPARVEFTMAIEAGRRGGSSASLVSRPENYTTGYGYNCGEGWVNKGVAKKDFFAS